MKHSIIQSSKQHLTKAFYMCKRLFCCLIASMFFYVGNSAYSAETASVSSADSKANSELLMDLSLADLFDIEVTTASKTEEKLSEAPGVISLITRDEMERFGARTLKDVLMRMPSIALSSIYMTDRSSVAIRGDQINPAANHTLLLINGRPVREALEGGIKSEMYESFPVASIDRIEVIRGPGSVLYGSNAFTGVFNIITKKAEENNTSVSVDLGLPGGIKYGRRMANAAYQIGDFGLVAGVYHKNEKPWDVRFQARDTVFRNFSIPDNGYGSYAELDWKKVKYMTSFDHWQNFFAMQKYIPSIRPYVPPTIVGKNAFGNVAWDKWFNDLGYTQDISSKWNMSFNATYTQSWLAVDSFPSPQRNSYDLTGEWTNFFKPKEDLNIILGILGNRAAGDQWGKTQSSIKQFSFQNCISGYLQADYHVIPELKIIGGLQGNKTIGFDFDLNPRIGFIWSPKEVINLKALYSTAFRAPTIQERFSKAPTLNGNRSLKPEKIHTFDLGVNIQSNAVMLGINSFYSTITNSIYQKQRVSPLPNIYDNNNTPTIIMGLEVEGKYFITKELMLTGSGLYQKNSTEDSAGNMMPVPEASVKGGVSYSSNGITASIFNIYEGKLDKRYNTQYNPTRKAFNLLNANIKYEINRLFKLKLPVITLEIDGYNLLDKEIWLPATGQSTRYTLPAIEGASLYFGLTVSF